MRVMLYIAIFFFLLAPIFSGKTAQGLPPELDTLRSEFANRYGYEVWPGRYGMVVAGIRPEDISIDGIQLDFDHGRWIEVNGEWVWIRQLESKDGKITLDLAIARTCRTAHRLLFDHLVRPRSMKPFDPPALPYGEIRLDDTGDICFALPQHGREEFHSIEFVRNNIVILLTARREVSVGLKDIAGRIDSLILSRPAYRDWRGSGLWPRVDRFDVPSGEVKSRSMIPLLVSVTDPGNEPFTISWDLSSGGILEEKGSRYYYAEGSGTKTINLLVANRSGLASSARTEIQVVE